MDSKIPTVLLRQSYIERTNIYSDNCELIDSKSVILYDSEKPIEIEEIFSNSVRIKIKFITEKKEGEGHSLQFRVFPESNVIEYICSNFDNPLGTGTSKPIEIGMVDNKKIYIHFWLYSMGGENGKARKLEYSLWRER